MAGRVCHARHDPSLMGRLTRPGRSAMLPAVHWLFVYGTLMPGRLRWPHVADLVAETRPATVPGTLYDTGRGYPALLLTGSSAVEGVLLGVRDEDAPGVLTLLDEVEG